MSVNPETERRRALARRIVEVLADRTDLRATLLTGSAATGTADEHSDIDLLNYYDAIPDPEQFDRLLLALDAERIGDIAQPRKEGFAARYQSDGIEVQTGGNLIVALEERLERIAAGDVDWITAKVAMGLLGESRSMATT